MHQPKPGHMKYGDFIHDLEKGVIKIPQFQRDFVWSIDESASLLDSVIKGYPIGTFILWKTKEELRTIKNIGNINLPVTPNGDFIQYVLDGQQRMTSLYASLKGVKVTKDEKKVDYSKMYVDLIVDDDSERFVITDVSEKEAGSYITLDELINGGLSLATKYDVKYHKKIEQYAKSIGEYQFSTITVENVSIDVATEIFTRINVGGQDLTVFEIMVAKTYDVTRNFDLAEKYDQLKEKLGNIGYETVPSSTLLQAIAVCLVKECSKKQILRLEKKDIIDIWDDVIDAFEHAIEYFKTFFRIPVSQLLPYNGLVVPFTYFFYKNKKKPTGIKQKYLQDYFWRTTLNSRFSNSMETKVGQDIKKMDLILNDELPEYENGVDISIKTLARDGYFSTGKSYIKGMLCLLTYQIPKSFNDDSIITVDNNWLKQANSKNYHHFFPRAYLIKKGEDDSIINHIANITIVDDFLNKREIREKAPSKYMHKFAKENSKLSDTMKTHLIPNLEKFGIWEDDYDLFFKKRLQEFNKELKLRLVIQDCDTIK